MGYITPMAGRYF